MKKILLLMLSTIAVLTSCNKDSSENTEEIITGIEMPSMDEKFSSGQSVTIKGNGFTQNDIISFREALKADDINALITNITASEITFTVPDGIEPGEKVIILKRNEKEQLLGTLTITATQAKSKLYGLFWKNENSMSICEIDKQNGNITELKTLNNEEEIVNTVSIGQTIYGVNSMINGTEDQIVSFDTSTKSYKVITKMNDIEYMGVIDNKLYALTSKNGIIILHNIDIESGAITQSTNFGTVQNSETWEGSYGGRLTYDKKNKTILILGNWYYKTDNMLHTSPIALNIAAQTLKELPRLSDQTKSWEELFNKSDVICAVISSRDAAKNTNEHTIYTLNSDYGLNQKLTTISEYSYNWSYDEEAEKMYCAYFAYNVETQEEIKGIGTFDFKTSTFSRLKHGINIVEVILVK